MASTFKFYEELDTLLTRDMLGSTRGKVREWPKGIFDEEGGSFLSTQPPEFPWLVEKVRWVEFKIRLDFGGDDG